MNNLIDKKDLSRWNRAGLDHFRYIDGNAITFLEALRQKMKDEFTEDTINKWLSLDTDIVVPLNETAHESTQRWITQYKADRRDYAWEILRTYARSTHVLTEYIDAYANESFLRTATEWDNVRRLVEMIDYHPAPPASAETPIILLAKSERSGVVRAGFAFKNKPSDGSSPVVFETLKDLHVDSELNEIRGKNWDKSQEIFTYNMATLSAVFPLEEPVENVSVGTLGVLLIEREASLPIGIAVTVSAVTATQLDLLGEQPSFIPKKVFRHQVRLLLKPESKKQPLLFGANVMILTAEHGLSVGAVVAWRIGSSWYVAKILQMDGVFVKLSRVAPADPGTKIFRVDFSLRQTYEINGKPENRIVLPTHLTNQRYWGVWDENLNTVPDSHNHASAGDSYLFDYFVEPSYERLYYIPKTNAIATVIRSNPQGLLFSGKAKKLATTDWLIVKNSAESLAAASVVSIAENADDFTLQLSRTLSDVDTVYHDFSVNIRPLNYNKNKTPIFLTDLEQRSTQYSILPLSLISIPSLLDNGRSLIVAGKNTSTEVRVTAVDEHKQEITVEPALPGSKPSESGQSEDYTRYDTIIYANVVQSGHGETQNKKILGSGDAIQINQTFHLDVNDICFISAADFSSGVKADLQVSVDGRIYQQVSTLNDSESEDPHYTVRIREDATLDITFGSGIRGRRLSSGNNNVEIIYRTGNGLVGNLPALQLEKEIKPHYLVDGILQKLRSTGGNDMEPVESMRSHAPASVLTLERAVSITDFTYLAQANSSVWQANAVQVQPGAGREHNVTVAIVPAGGGDLGILESTLQNYLSSNTLPGIKVTVTRYQAVLLRLNLIIHVKTDEFDLHDVGESVRKHLLNTFSLKKSQLGKTFYRSQIIQVVENVTGVENCLCQIVNLFVDEFNLPVTPQQTALSLNGKVKRITPSWKQIVYLDETLSSLSITTRELTL